MKSFVFLLSTVLILLYSATVLAQQTYTAQIPGISKYISDDGNNFFHSGTGVLYAGKNGDTYRSYISWYNIRTYVPQGSKVTNVEFYITWGGSGASTAQIEYHEVYISGNPQQDYDNINTGTRWDTKSATTTTYSFPELTAKVQSAVNSGNDAVYIGIKNQNESDANKYVSYIYNVDLYVTYEGSNVIVNQLDADDSPFGAVDLWEANDWSDNPVPFSPENLQNGDHLVLRGDQDLNEDPYQKYNKWLQNTTEFIINHHDFTILTGENRLTSKFEQAYQGVIIENSLEGLSPNSGKIKFADPWYIDYADPDFDGSLRNRGMKNSGLDALQFRERTSPFQPDFNTVYQNGVDPSNSYQGVFLNQTPDPNNPDKPYYSVQAVSPQPIPLGGSIGTRNFYFFDWDYDPNDISLQSPNNSTTAVVFKNANAVVKANLKGHLLSNNENAINKGTQRRLVRTDNGIYHLVYESMGAIWYTHSLTGNFNGSWSDELGIEIGTNPSLDFEGNSVSIVLEKADPDYSGDGIIEMATLNSQYNDFNLEEVAHFPLTYYGNAKPVIANIYQKIVIVYRKNLRDGLYQRTKWYEPSTSTWHWANEGNISNSDSYSINPSITGISDYFFLVYEHSYSIKFIYGYWYSSSQTWSYRNESNISDGSGNNVNVNPCISLLNNFQPVVSWVGSYSQSSINKSVIGIGGNIPPMVVVRVGNTAGTSWGSFFKASSDVVSVSNNSSNNTSDQQSVIVWSEGTSPNYNSKWVRRINSNYVGIQNLSDDGLQNQVSNGTDLNNMKAVTLSTSTTPYDVIPASTDFMVLTDGGGGGLTKVNTENNLSYGREGIISKGGIDFLFDTGDILVGDSAIKFIERADTLVYNSDEEINNDLRTESFTLFNNTQFYFTNFYYVLNSEIADSVLTDEDEVNFKVELVNSQTSAVVGTFDNVTYSKNNMDEYNNISYQVDCSNITPGQYYLRLVVAVAGSANYFLANVQNDDANIAKRNYVQVGYNGLEAPTTYEISQNYPNPFNPSTTIKYQIPKDGVVTLKVYDILGREVANLVDGFKTKGRYEVKFDASKLATGVYIYRIKAGDFVQTKKMMLLK